MMIKKLGNLIASDYEICGGKAKGLDILKKNEFQISDGFVILSAKKDEIFANKEAILSFFDELNCEEVSVRSSASNEDGENASSAGQFDTYLFVKKENLIEKILLCIDSLENDRAKSYADNFLDSKSSCMNIVIEKMIFSKYSGVLFSKNPNGEGSLIEVVEGQGENLVSGSSKAEAIIYSADNLDLISSSYLSKEALIDLINKASKIKDLFDFEIDLEWAIDEKGNFYFLQVRPITTFNEPTIDEFNSKCNLDNHLLTTRNIGEMFPGVATPLSISTSVLAIDYGMRYMLKRVGVVKSVNDLPDFYCSLAYKGHLFIDMSALYTMHKKCSLTTPEQMNLSILGEFHEDYPKSEGKDSNWFVKTFNTLKFIKYLFSNNKAKRGVKKINDNLNFEEKVNFCRVYDEICRNLHYMNDALCYHYVCSSYSGSMNSALYLTFSKLFDKPSDYQIFVANILSNIPDIESADILRRMTDISLAIAKKYPNYKDIDEKELEEICNNKNNEEINKLYKEFLQIHGHRSIKEAELRSKAWKNDIESLMTNLKTVLHSIDLSKDYSKNDFNIDEVVQVLPKKMRKAGKVIGKMAREAVVSREYSKSNIIKTIDKFKDQYIVLADLLNKEGILPDKDLIYFLTNEEIGKLINGDIDLVKKALKRRKVYSQQEKLKFNDIYIGSPEPIKPTFSNSEKSFKGTAVSKGKVYGRAKIVQSTEDAKNLKDGDIMVACFTDIGWSPYYSIIGGLITEVGSALSHGAVVAREYSLPTIVNVSGATTFIKDGDYLYLDADSGEIVILTEEEYKANF